ncbi:MFS transporter, partial [Candidatus Woesearchaeota archaeon]|nr:MFS transporter [Candidatus Woesearchaeota archaeon]
MFKIKYRLPLNGALALSLVSFMLSLSMAVTAPIYPLFVKEFVKNDAYVGYVFTFSSLLLILLTFVVVHLLRLYPKYKLLRMSLIGFTLTYLVLPFLTTLNQLLFLTIFRAFFIVTALMTTGLLIRETVDKKGKLGSTEGFYFTILNLAWLFGPLIGGPFAKRFGFNTTFLLAGGFAFIAYLIWAYKSKEHKLEDEKKETNNKHFLENLKEYLHHKNLIVVYLLSFGLPFWWSLIYIYLPLFLAAKAVSASVIGYALFLVVIPLIFLEFPIGRIADKIGYRKLLVFGYLFMAIIAFLIARSEDYIWIIGLFIIGCFGTALVEPLREAFFFKITKKDDELRFYSVYRTAFDTGYLVAPIIYSVALSAGSFKSLFLAGAFLMLLFGIIAAFIKEHGHIHH